MRHPIDGYSEQWLDRKLAATGIKITLSGNLLTWQVKNGQSKIPSTKGRGNVIEFSRASRLRMLKFVARIDWEKLGNGVFLTLTYPDEVERTNSKQLGQDRYLIHRAIELEVGHHTPALWRMEWQARKSGPKTNYLYPHYHLLLFREQFISADRIREMWQGVIHSTVTPRINIEAMTTSKHAAKYVSKYAAKSSDNLVIAAYHNNAVSGRQWGILRKELIPMCDEMFAIRKESATLKALREHILVTILGRSRESATSFTVLGDNAEKVGKLIFGDLTSPDREKE